MKPQNYKCLYHLFDEKIKQIEGPHWIILKEFFEHPLNLEWKEEVKARPKIDIFVNDKIV